TTNATTAELQKEELNVITATEMIASLAKLLQKTRNDDLALQGIIQLAEKEIASFGTDIECEFDRLHRTRLRSCRTYANNTSAYAFTSEQFYTTLFRTILDHLHGQYNEYFEILNSTLKSFRHISPPTIENFSQTEADELTALISGIDDSLLLFQEFQQLTPEIKECTDMRAVAKMLKSVHLRYPRLARVYEFMLTLPVTVASNERSFSKLKNCDLLDHLDLAELVAHWTLMKDRKTDL
ncbi:unnamed protein product, partial [Didymodactylos carnosus]